MPSEPLQSDSTLDHAARRDPAPGVSAIDFSRRLPLAAHPEWMDLPCSRHELHGALRDLARINRLLFGYRPILTFLASIPAPHRPLRILDVGTGYGDTLRRIHQWARGRGLSVDLTGLDVDSDTTALAREATPPAVPIHFVTTDVFSYTPPQPPDVILSSLMMHHLEDEEIVRLLRWMEAHARLGWCINDLSRHPTPYRLFGWFARLLRLHPFVQHDGPISIARAFRAEDWERYCAAAGLRAADVEIRGFTPGRLRVSRSKSA